MRARKLVDAKKRKQREQENKRQVEQEDGRRTWSANEGDDTRLATCISI